MIWQVFIYSTLVAAALGLAGVGLERVAARHGLPRRLVWATAMAVSILFPVWAMWRAEPVPQPAPAVLVAGAFAYPGPALLPPAEEPVSEQAAIDLPVTPRHEGNWREAIIPGSTLLAIWMFVSLALLMYQAAAAWLLGRQASRWARAEVLGERVLISAHAGPALLGAFRPRIVIPRWFLAEPVHAQSLILAHERQHLRSRDPLLLWCCVLAATLLPWNLPLWWQLRRLRLAIELDCDARVLRLGADPDTYGEVLLTVTRRAVNVPMGAVAMSEPASALELRIRHLVPNQSGFTVLRVAGAVALAAAGFLVTWMLKAPAMRTAPVHVADAAPPVLLPMPEASAAPATDALPDQPGNTTELPASVQVTSAIDAQPTTREPPRTVTLQSPLLPVNYDAWRAHRLVQNVALQRYPTLHLPFDGEVRNQVTLLFRADGTVEKEFIERLPRGELVRGGTDPGQAAVIAQRIAQRLEIDPDRIGAVGVTDAYRQVPLPDVSGEGATLATQTRVDLLRVVFAWPRRAGEAAPSLMMPDGAMNTATSADPVASLMPPRDPLDAAAALALVERHLPDAFMRDEAAAGTPVILLGPNGQFIRAGWERIPGTGSGPRLIRDSQLLGMHTNQVSWKNITNHGGDRADVLFAWLAPPGDRR